MVGFLFTSHYNIREKVKPYFMSHNLWMTSFTSRGIYIDKIYEIC